MLNRLDQKVRGQVHGRNSSRGAIESDCIPIIELASVADLAQPEPMLRAPRGNAADTREASPRGARSIGSFAFGGALLSEGVLPMRPSATLFGVIIVAGVPQSTNASGAPKRSDGLQVLDRYIGDWETTITNKATGEKVHTVQSRK
jgi:hypothetical protein